MIKKILLAMFILLLLQTKVVFAHSPLTLNLDYNSDSEMLNVEVVHMSRNRNHIYIRKMKVYKNDDDPIIFYYRRQGRPRTFTKDISIKADADDVIQVKVFCSKGGSKEGSIIIPEIEKEGTDVIESLPKEPVLEDDEMLIYDY